MTSPPPGLREEILDNACLGEGASSQVGHSRFWPLYVGSLAAMWVAILVLHWSAPRAEIGQDTLRAAASEASGFESPKTGLPFVQEMAEVPRALLLSACQIERVVGEDFIENHHHE